MIAVHELPYLTAAIPGIGGRIKARPQDFVVEEVPLYAASGEGTHIYFEIEKSGLTTMQAVAQIAKALGRAARDIGYAGLKDAEAVTRQTLSVEHIDPTKIEALELNRIRIVRVGRHTNKLKLGHLAGNRFVIRIRDVDPARAGDAGAMLDLLERRGVPNYFGPQRFGMRGDTWEIGRALLRGDPETAIGLILGRVGPGDYGQVRRARELFDSGEYEKAAQAWPYPFNNERRLCYAVAKNGGQLGKSVRAIEPQMKRFYVSAYQSQMFNQIVVSRLERIDQLIEGDLAWRHPQGAVFRVEDVEKEQPRCQAFEISPTGPLFGYRMTEPSGEPGAAEQAVLASEGMKVEDWRQGTTFKIKGARRPLRFQPQETAVESGRDDLGDYIELRFRLESGCYATTVLREICKTDALSGDELAESDD